MAEEMDIGCARPTGGPVGETVEEESNEPGKNAIIKRRLDP